MFRINKDIIKIIKKVFVKKYLFVFFIKNSAPINIIVNPIIDSTRIPFGDIISRAAKLSVMLCPSVKPVITINKFFIPLIKINRPIIKIR